MIPRTLTDAALRDAGVWRTSACRSFRGRLIFAATTADARRARRPGAERRGSSYAIGSFPSCRTRLRAAAPVGYSMCAGQHLTQTSPPSRSWAVSVQLAPAFLDEMATCNAEDSMSKDLPGRAGSGSIDEKGNCVFASVGVSCHYHSLKKPRPAHPVALPCQSAKCCDQCHRRSGA
jgi:hypothetical protein